jgi:hypothetical protein
VQIGFAGLALGSQSVSKEVAFCRVVMQVPIKRPSFSSAYYRSKASSFGVPPDA